MEYLRSFLGQGRPQQEFTDQSFYDWIERTHLLKKITKKLYLHNLMLLQNDMFPSKRSVWWIITHPDESLKAIQDYGHVAKGRMGGLISTSSLKNFTTIIVSLILHNNEIQERYPDLLKRWRNITQTISQPLIDQVDSNQPTKRQGLAFIPFDQVCHLRDQLELGSPERLLIALYTMIPPVRSNFDRVRIYREDPHDDKQNYIVLCKDPILCLNKYKTSDLYDEVEIPIPDVLLREIIASLKDHPREYLFVDHEGHPYEISGSWNRWANNTLKRVFKNPNFSLTTFRHIYLSRPDLKLGQMTRKERKEIAKTMGHSLDTQSKYQFMEREDLD